MSMETESGKTLTGNSCSAIYRIANSMRIINSFVAIFDFLGFRALREARGTDGLFQLYERGLLPSIQHAAAGGGKVTDQGYVPDPGPMSVTAMIFSDTIVLLPGGADYDAFCRIVHASQGLLVGSFCGHKAVLRGGIGYGDLVLNDYNILLGSAVEDAHLCESSQAWAGCSFSEKCEEYIRANSFLNCMRDGLQKFASHEQNEAKRKKIEKAIRLIVEYDIPIYRNPKSGPADYSTVKGLALDWTLNTYEGASQKGMPESKDPHALRIIENTRAFETWARANNR